jgi:hypothetical protein
MKGLVAAFVALSFSALSWAAGPAGQDVRRLASALHESAMRAALGHPGVTVCRQLLVGIAERDWVRGEVVEVQGHLIGIRVDDPGRFPHILKGVSYHHGALVWSTPSLWTPCL